MIVMIDASEVPDVDALVTGGCGFVGRNLTRTLLKDGEDVLIVDNLASGEDPSDWLIEPYTKVTESENRTRYEPDTRRNGELHFIQTDVRTFLEKCRDVHFREVYHLAAVIGGRTKIEGEPLKVGSDLAIDSEFFNWAIEANPEKVLYSSSSAAYPTHLQNGEETRKLREDDINFDTTIGVPDMTYGWSKLTGEYLGRIAAEHYGLSVAVIRPFSGYGEEQSLNYPVPAIAKRAVDKKDPLTVWGSGHQVRDFVHIDDVIEAMRIATETISDGSAVNIGTGKPTNFIEVAETFADIVGYNPAIKTLPDKPEGVEYRCADITHMRETLDWNPSISIESGFERVVNSVKDRTS